MSFKSTALLAAKSAGKILLKYYGRGEKPKEKPNKSLVSKADLEANKAIISIIKKRGGNSLTFCSCLLKNKYTSIHRQLEIATSQ